MQNNRPVAIQSQSEVRYSQDMYNLHVVVILTPTSFRTGIMRKAHDPQSLFALHIDVLVRGK